MYDELLASCGGKRRGCCIIELPHDSELAKFDSDCSNQCSFFLVLGLSAGRPSTWAVVSVPNSEVADFMGKATW
jgi:hypothetical protein